MKKKYVTKYAITIGMNLKGGYEHHMDVIMTEEEFEEYKKMSVEEFKKSKWFDMMVTDLIDKYNRAVEKGS